MLSTEKNDGSLRNLRTYILNLLANFVESWKLTSLDFQGYGKFELVSRKETTLPPPAENTIKVSTSGMLLFF